MAAKREKAWTVATWATLKAERKDLGAGKRALETLAAASEGFCASLLALCIAGSAGQTGPVSTLSPGAVAAAAQQLLPADSPALRLVLEAVASRPAPPPELVAAVRLQSPACRAAADGGAEALAAAVGAAVGMLVQAASELTDARHAAAGVIDGSLFLQDINGALEADSALRVIVGS